jgi:hypothetical protein
LTGEKRLRCLFFGSLSSLAVMGRVAAFVASGFEVSLINVSVPNPYGRAYPVPGANIVDDWHERGIDSFDKRLKGRYNWYKCHIEEHLRNYRLLPEPGSLRRRLHQIISDFKPDFAVLHYGTIAIHYARLIKRESPWLPVIDIINVVPVNLASKNSWRSKWTVLIELDNYRRWLPYVEGVVYSSAEMQDFALREFGNLGILSAIIPDYLPSSIHPTSKQLPNIETKREENPSVIFLGAPERWGNDMDDIDREFMEIAKAKIHVYSATISEEVKATGFGHSFSPFNIADIFAGRLANFATTFDAAIITYNTDVSQRKDRFRSNIPTRFFTAIASCMPVAVEEGKLEACEKFVSKHGNGFIYSDATDLRKKLLDKDKLSQYRETAVECAKWMNSEMQREDIRSFVAKVIGEEVKLS